MIFLLHNKDSNPGGAQSALNKIHSRPHTRKSTFGSPLLSRISQHALHSLNFLNEIRPRLYGDYPEVVTHNLIYLPQPNMGADPILTSATAQQGSCHSNHGGK
jgi:hypothetical protein